MDTSKVYFDSEGNECSIWRMVKREPTWAAVRIQEGEKAIDEITTLRQQLADAEAQSEALRQELQNQLTAQWKVGVDYAESLILRKQAEALESVVGECEGFDQVWDRAQDLRQQADELEQK